MSVDETTWAEIRRAYEDGPETVANLAARYTVSVRRIYSRAKAEGWRGRRRSTRTLEPAMTGSGCEAGSAGEAQSQSLVPSLAQVAAAEPEDSLRRGPVNTRSMIARLYNAIDDKLKQLEARMGSGREISAAESERETRELGVMIRSFEKVTEFATEIENRRKTAAPERISATDAERMRAEIAERLERLNNQGNPGAGSDGAK